MVSDIQLVILLNNYSPALLSAAYYVSMSVYVMLAATIILAIKRTKGLTGGLYALSAIAFISLINYALKLSFNEPRPGNSGLNIIQIETDPAFPSGHASASFGAAALSGKNIFYIWAALIAISRIILGVHYLRDIIAGAAVGYVIGKLASKYEKKIYDIFLSKKNVFETRRKLVHGLLGIPVAAFVFLAPKPLATEVLFASIIVLFIISEIIKRKIYIPLISEGLGIFEREKDMQYFPLKGAIFFMTGSFISTLLYPGTIASAAIIILALGDSFSTIVGKPLGKTKHAHNSNKSVEGSIAGLVAAFVGAVFLVPPLIALAGAFSGMLVESFDLKIFGIEIDDNFSVPIICGAVMAAVAGI